MISVAKVQPGNAWRYYLRGVAVGDGRRPARKLLKTAQREVGLPPGVWMGRGLPAFGLTAGETVTQRQMELLFGEGRHPDADRMERERLDDSVDPDTARLEAVLGQPIEEIEKRKQTPLLALDFVFRPQASLIVLWALGDDHTRRVIERAHERAIATVLRWLEDEIAETRWSSGRKRAKTPALVVARFRHFDNRDGSPLLHDHCLIFNRVQRPDGAWYALDTRRLYQNVVAAGTLYTLTMTTEVCEELGLATVPREVTPGLRPVMEIAVLCQVLRVEFLRYRAGGRGWVGRTWMLVGRSANWSRSWRFSMVIWCRAATSAALSVLSCSSSWSACARSSLAFTSCRRSRFSLSGISPRARTLA